jgi:hypothetical protein
MQVCARCIPFILLLLSAGCGTLDQNREIDLVYAVVTLPQGFRYEWGVGDTPCGNLLSLDGKTVIEFDLGFYAGTYASPKGNRACVALSNLRQGCGPQGP